MTSKLDQVSDILMTSHLVGHDKLDDMVKISPQIPISWEGEHFIQILIEHIFSQLELHGWDASYMTQRAILTPINDDVQKLNDILIN
jgi:hypothetical protein